MAESQAKRNTSFGLMRSNTKKALLELIAAASSEAGREGTRSETQDDGGVAGAPAGDAPREQAVAHGLSLASLSSLSRSDEFSSGTPVSALRPRPGLLIECGTTVAAAARKMHAANMDVCLVTDAGGQMKGILTDSDVRNRHLF
jgi:hypothetical protein